LYGGALLAGLDGLLPVGVLPPRALCCWALRRPPNPWKFKMFAVIKTGGKQFRVAEDEVLKVGRLTAKPGEIVTFPVIMLGGDNPVIGSPAVEGAQVAAEGVEEGRSRTVIAFKKRRRQNSKRKRGYRDPFTLVRITEILTDGKQTTKTARAKPEKKAKAEVPAEDADTDTDTAAKPKAKAKAPAKKAAAKKAPAKKAAAKKTAAKKTKKD
jgi:large subunit ribosomal protein L21